MPQQQQQQQLRLGPKQVGFVYMNHHQPYFHAIVPSLLIFLLEQFVQDLKMIFVLLFLGQLIKIHVSGYIYVFMSYKCVYKLPKKFQKHCDQSFQKNQDLCLSKHEYVYSSKF